MTFLCRAIDYDGAYPCGPFLMNIFLTEPTLAGPYL
jgi:hypothetical protein